MANFLKILLINSCLISTILNASWPDAWELAEAFKASGEIWAHKDQNNIPLIASPITTLGYGEIEQKKRNWPEEIWLHMLIERGYSFHAVWYNGFVIASLIEPKLVLKAQQSPEEIVFEHGSLKRVEVISPNKESLSFLRYSCAVETNYGGFVKENSKAFYKPYEMAVALDESLPKALRRLMSVVDFNSRISGIESGILPYLLFPFELVTATGFGGVVFNECPQQYYITKKFIKPNEPSPFLFKSHLKEKKGALVSVGSFRTFIDAGMGNFDTVVGFDISPHVTRFNRYHQKLLTQIDELQAYTKEKRVLYLLALRNLWPKNSHALKQLIRSRADICAHLAQNKPVPLRGKFKDPPASIAKTISHMRASLASDIEADLRFSVTGIFNSHEISSLLEAYYEPDALKRNDGDPISYYWESDKAWRKLIGYFKAGKFNHVTMDITNFESMEKLKTALNNLNIKVSVLDISNLLDWVSQAGEIERFVNALANMDFSPEALVFITHDKRVMADKAPDRVRIFSYLEGLGPPLALYEDENWQYAAYDLQSFLKNLRDSEQHW